MSSGSLIGAAIVAGFAVLWVAAGTASLGQRWAWGCVVAACGVSLTLVFAAVQRAPTATGADAARRFDGLAYGLAVAFESTAIPLAVICLRRTARGRYILPAVAFIVGLRFFGLILAFGSPACGWIGAALCVLAALTVGFCRPPLNVPMGGLIFGR